MSESQTAPIVLVHGIFGFDQITFGGVKVANYYRLIPGALRRDGHVVPHPPQTNRAGYVADRAQDLKNYLQDPNRVEVFEKKIHLVAHSMGGLDARSRVAAEAHGADSRSFGDSVHVHCPH